MTTAAAPEYLGRDFSQASPALRFGMYLPVWSKRDWSKPQKTGDTVWRSILALGGSDKQQMQALIDRHKALAVAMDPQSFFMRDMVSTAPFVTGLGNEHPLENGFSFLSPYGLPYLPGSSIKGVVRQAATELAGGDWGETHGWTPSRIDTLFGPESDDEDQAWRGALTFWDVIPQIKDERLTPEIMTPHQSHYYQQQNGSVPPHDSGQPIPIHFLAVPAGSGFSFAMACNRTLLKYLDSQQNDNLAQNEQWKDLLAAAFDHACSWLGFGAKTAVGYGAMAEDTTARRGREDQDAENRAAAEREKELGQMSEAEREIERIYDAEPNKAVSKVVLAIKALVEGEWDNNRKLKLEIARRVKSLMQKDKDWNTTNSKAKGKKGKNYDRSITVQKILDENG